MNAHAVARLAPVELLFSAIERWDVKRVEHLLDEEIGLYNACDEQGATPLMHACANGHEPLAKLLLESGARCDSQNNMGWTALMQASRYGHFAVIQLLIRYKADLHLHNSYGGTALGAAVRSGHISVVQLLLREGARVNPEISCGTSVTPLMIAAKTGNEPVARLLVQEGAKVNAACISTGWTALMFAAISGKLGVIQLLVENGVDTNSETILEATALDIAATQGHVLIEKYLEDVTATRKSTRILDTIFDATKRGDFTRVRDMLDDNEALLNQTDSDGATPLMFACMRGFEQVTELLIYRGANLNAQDNISGWTPIMQATYYGHLGVTRLLIDNGADVNLQAVNGCTAFDIAATIADTELIRLLSAVTSSKRNSRSNSAKKNTSGGFLRNIESGVIVNAVGNATTTGIDEGFTQTRPLKFLSMFIKRAAAKIRYLGHKSDNVIGIMPTPQFTTQRSVPGSTGAVLDGALPKDVARDGSVRNLKSSGLATEILGMSLHDDMMAGRMLKDIKPPFLPAPAFDVKMKRQMPLASDRQQSVFTQSHGDLYASLDISATSGARIMSPLPKGNRSSPTTISTFTTSARPACKVIRQGKDASNTTTVSHDIDSVNNVHSPSNEGEDSRPSELTVASVLESIGLSRYFHIFEAEEVDFQTFITLTADDLKELGVAKLGPRKQILACIERLNSEANIVNMETITTQLLQGLIDN